MGEPQLSDPLTGGEFGEADLFDPAGDLEPVERLETQGLEDEEIQGALDQVGLGGCHGGQSAAIKVVRSEISAATSTDRFLREIRLAAPLHHPNILPLRKRPVASNSTAEGRQQNRRVEVRLRK